MIVIFFISVILYGTNLYAADLKTLDVPLFTPILYVYNQSDTEAVVWIQRAVHYKTANSSFNTYAYSEKKTVMPGKLVILKSYCPDIMLQKKGFFRELSSAETSVKKVEVCPVILFCAQRGDELMQSSIGRPSDLSSISVVIKPKQ